MGRWGGGVQGHQGRGRLLDLKREARGRVGAVGGGELFRGRRRTRLTTRSEPEVGARGRGGRAGGEGSFGIDS